MTLADSQHVARTILLIIAAIVVLGFVVALALGYLKALKEVLREESDFVAKWCFGVAAGATLLAATSTDLGEAFLIGLGAGVITLLIIAFQHFQQM